MTPKREDYQRLILSQLRRRGPLTLRQLVAHVCRLRSAPATDTTERAVEWDLAKLKKAGRVICERRHWQLTTENVC